VPFKVPGFGYLIRSATAIPSRDGGAEVTRRLRSVSQFASEQPFTEPQLRWWIFQAESNGMNAAGAIVRLGRRVYIDADGFERWISAQNPPAYAQERRTQT
jgi:hypothetical protein